MKVPFVCGPGDMQLLDIERPVAGPGDVVLQVASVGICGSDLGFIAAGGMGGPTPKPFPIGHELSGIVMEAGTDVHTVSVGDRVILNPLVNMIGNGATEGGFGEHLLVRDVAGQPGSLLRLPAHISLDHGALIEPLAVSTHALNRMRVERGDKVAIFGAGPIGLAAVVALAHRGIDDVVIFDFSPLRRERALALGASVAFDPREHAPAEVLGRAHVTTPFYGHPLPATTHYLEATGAPIIADIVGYCRPGATICIASLQKKTIEINPQLMLAKELLITGTFGYPTEMADVLAMLESGAIDLEPMVSHRFPGTDIMAAFDMARRPDEAAKVLVQYA